MGLGERWRKVRKGFPGDHSPAKRLRRQRLPCRRSAPGLTTERLRGHPGALRGFLASLPQGSWGRTHIVLGGVPPFLHVHHGGILHAVGEHLPPQSEWRPPAASPSHPGPAPAPCPTSRVSPATPGRRAAARAPRAHRYGRWAGAVQRARGLRAPGRLPVGLPRSPSLPRRRSSPARPPGGSGGNWRSRGGAGVCPAGEGTGRGPRSLLSARWGGAGGAPSLRSGSGGLGADGGCGRRRRRQGRAGREGKGGERGEARGEGLRARGRGSGRRGGGLRPGRRGRSGPARPHRAESAASGLAGLWSTSPGTETRGGFGGRRGEGE